MKTEKTFGIIFLLALTLKFFNVPGSILLLIFSLFTLSLLYFPFGFYFFSDKNLNRQNTPLSVLGGMVLSIAVLGILFKLLFWPGGSIQLLTAFILTPLLFLICFFLSRKNNEDLKIYYKNYKLRIIFWFALTVIFMTVTGRQLIILQYRTSPERELKLKAHEHPDDPENQKALEKYYHLRDSMEMVKDHVY